MVERHVLALLRRHVADPAEDEPGMSAERIAEGTGMSRHRAGVVVEGLRERGMVSISASDLELFALTDSGRMALERAGGWPPHRS